MGKEWGLSAAGLGPQPGGRWIPCGCRKEAVVLIYGGCETQARGGPGSQEWHCRVSAAGALSEGTVGFVPNWLNVLRGGEV